jgi:uncharacterized protein (DUF362 family)
LLDLLQSKEKVIIKPNLCDNAAWETGVTTDPEWIRVLATAIRRHRPEAMIQVVESDAISAYRAFRSADETFDRLEYREVAKAVNSIRAAPHCMLLAVLLGKPLYGYATACGEHKAVFEHSPKSWA